MDGTRFDDLTRLVGRGTTRRRVIAAALGMTAIAVEAGTASAARTVCRPFGVGCTRNQQCCSANCVTGKHLPRNVRNRCGCAVGYSRCDGACIDTSADNDNCGGCDISCDTVNGETCFSGACVCDTGLTECDGVCVDTDTDEANCGACDTVCDVINGEECQDGTCFACSGLLEPCSVDADCCDPINRICDTFEGKCFDRLPG